MSVKPSSYTEAAEYALGFTTLDDEITVEALPVIGHIPAWLSGTLIRNGPGQFELEGQSYRHWFDGLAMLHRFTVHAGDVSYTNRLLHSQDYEASTASGKVSMRGFATDPCMTAFRRVMALFQPNMTDNGSINVVNWAGRFIALTESPFAVEFDPATLETTAHRDFSDHVLSRAATTAHPHVHPTTGEIYNFAVRFDIPTSAYRVYTYDPALDARRLVGEVPVGRPSYIHSFGLTEQYAIIAAYPYTVRVRDLAFSGRAFIENYTWDPAGNTRFMLVRLSDGVLAGTFETEPFFAFHHMNAYDDGDSVVVDLVAYEDNRAVTGLYLNKIREGDRSTVPAGEPRRYRLNTATGEVRTTLLSDTRLELPRIHSAYSGRAYRFVYGISADEVTHVGFPNQLAKIDVETGASHVWRGPGCYPGEPVFVPTPDATAEDDGLLLSVVLDVVRKQSFLLVLDARDLSEMARAMVPHHIPFGFHGQFYVGIVG